MRSRAESRGLFEAALRVLSVSVLAFMLWRLIANPASGDATAFASGDLSRPLRQWSSAGIAPGRIFIELASTPGPLERSWLGALAGAGSTVGWSGDLPVVGAEASRVPTPRGGMAVAVAAPDGEQVILSDDLGVLDTARASAGGARFVVPSASGSLIARAGGSVARVPLPDSSGIRRVLVLGAANWETRFVVAALEEDGWTVNSEMRVAPGVSVTQGVIGPLDTARYSAVIVLDATAGARAAEIVRYVASGGGAVLAGSAAAIEGFAAMRPGQPVRAQPTVPPGDAGGDVTLSVLGVVPLGSIRPDAIPLERRGTAVVAAARRHASGRVLHLGYAETWRWRLAGGDSSPTEHREWWTRAVASVAHAPVVRTGRLPAEGAPLAQLVGELGPASDRPGASLAPAAGAIPLWLLLALLSASLLGEWASRRLRGER